VGEGKGGGRGKRGRLILWLRGDESLCRLEGREKRKNRWEVDRTEAVVKLKRGGGGEGGKGI